jgi:hypothetical protein
MSEPTESRSDLDPDDLDETLREELEDRTEDTLYGLYDAVSPKLGEAFERLITRGSDEVRVLEELGREMGLETEPGENPFGSDPEADRIAWQPLARASTLALFDSLADQETIEAALSAKEWAERCFQGIDHKEFQATTSFDGEDIRLALHATAQAIVGFDELQRPVSLLYRDRYITFRADADAGTISAVETESQPLLFLPTEDVAETSDPAGLHLHFGSHFVHMVPLAPSVEIARMGNTLVTSGLLNLAPQKAVYAGLAIEPTAPWDYEASAEGVFLQFEEPVELVLASTSRVRRFGGGLLLERNVLEHGLRPGGPKGKAHSVAVAEESPIDTETIAQFVYKQTIE